MIMTSDMSYQHWHYTGFTARRLRFNIIIGHLLCCLHCFEGFTSGLLNVQFSVKGAYVCPRRGKIGDGNSWVEGNTFAQPGWGWVGGRHLKELTAVAFTLTLIVFALIWFWGGHVVQCYPPIISAIAETLQWKRNTGRVSLSPHSPILAPHTVSMRRLIE